MDNRKEVLEETIKCFENLISTIGEKTTEYHWREFAGIIKMITDSFPEYNLEEYQDTLFAKVEKSSEEKKDIWD